MFSKDLHHRHVKTRICLGKGYKRYKQIIKQEGQDGPGSLTWIFEIALANFYLSLSEKNLQEFLHVCTVQIAPIHLYHVYWKIKISRTVFEKGHTRNIPMKLFKNLTISFRQEDFLGIC